MATTRRQALTSKEPSEKRHNTAEPSAPAISRWVIPLAALALAGIATLAYSNTFAVPFVFDDETGIVTNRSIRSLRLLSDVLAPPVGETVGGRPLLNLTFAINYSFGQLHVWGYHLVNLIIHIAAGLTLFGLVRRTISASPTNSGGIPESARPHAFTLALASATLFVLHPLQTEAVTYIIQRAESLMALCYLLTLYALARSGDKNASTLWSVMAVLICALGMATKEVMVSAPIIALLYDRTFMARSFRSAWQHRSRIYLALGATWSILLGLALTHGRGTSAGFATATPVWRYALTRAYAIIHYLALFAWPNPLIFDYGTRIDQSLLQHVVFAVLILLLLAGVVWALIRRPVLGFGGAACFAILAPSSSVIPIATQVMAEHRMYLVLAALIPLVVVIMHRLAGRQSSWLFAGWALALGVITYHRNGDYTSRQRLWEDTIAKIPSNVRAHHNLARALEESGNDPEALVEIQLAVQLDSTSAGAQNDLGRMLEEEGRAAEAVKHFENALRLEPNNSEARFNYGATLVDLGEPVKGMSEFLRLAQARPDYPGLDAAVGEALVDLGRYQDAVSPYRRAVAQAPDSLDLRITLARLLVLNNRSEEAIPHLEIAVRHIPVDASLRSDLGQAFARTGQYHEAEAQLEEAVRLEPTLSSAVRSLGQVRKLLGHP